MIDPKKGFTCCNKKFNNCPVVTVRQDGVKGVVIEGDDGQMVEFTLGQFEVLIDGGIKVLEEFGL